MSHNESHEYSAENGWQNGNVTRLLTTVLALLLAGSIGTGGVAITKLSGVIEQVAALKESVDQLSERVLYLERRQSRNSERPAPPSQGN